MSAKRDALANVSPGFCILPQAIAADVDGTGVEVRGFEEVEVQIAVGLYTDGTFTLLVEESADDVTYTTVAAGDLDGSVPVLSASTDNQIHRVGYMGSSRYVRLTVAEPTSPNPTGVVLACTIERRRPHNAPV